MVKPGTGEGRRGHAKEDRDALRSSSVVLHRPRGPSRREGHALAYGRLRLREEALESTGASTVMPYCMRRALLSKRSV